MNAKGAFVAFLMLGVLYFNTDAVGKFIARQADPVRSSIKGDDSKLPSIILPAPPKDKDKSALKSFRDRADRYGDGEGENLGGDKDRKKSSSSESKSGSGSSASKGSESKPKRASQDSAKPKRNRQDKAQPTQSRGYGARAVGIQQARGL